MAESSSKPTLKRASMEVPALSKIGSKVSTSKNRNPLLSEKAIEYLNYRIQQEEYSARIYLAMSMWLEDNGYVNAAKLWRKYSDEEMSHGDWSRTHLLSFGVQPITPRLDSPSQDFEGLPEIIHDSYDHEILVTKQITELAGEALKLNDHMLYELALRFLKEQVEEHNKMQNWVDQLESFGEDKIAMRLLDHEMKDYL